MSFRGAVAALAVTCLLGLAVAHAQAAPPKAAGDKLTAVTYDVSDLIRKPGHTGYARVEDIIKLILTSVDPDAWENAGDSTLEEVNGTRLYVTTSAARHAQIKEVLAAARRLLDLRVDIKSELIELERKVYDKEFKAKLKGTAAVVEDKLVEDLRTRGTALKDAAVHAGDGETTTLFSLRRAFGYAAKPGATGNGARGAGLTGLRLSGAVSVTEDRRYVRLKLTRRVTELAGIKKRKIIDLGAGTEEDIEEPDLVESSETFNVTVGDGAVLLVPVTLADGKDRERVRLLVVRPRIYIEEEEKERNKEEEKERKKGSP
jgi:hypothetical protein